MAKKLNYLDKLYSILRTVEIFGPDEDVKLALFAACRLHGTNSPNDEDKSFCLTAIQALHSRGYIMNIEDGLVISTIGLDWVKCVKKQYNLA